MSSDAAKVVMKLNPQSASAPPLNVRTVKLMFVVKPPPPPAQGPAPACLVGATVAPFFMVTS